MEIVKGLPMPKENPAWPHAKMIVGDCFLVHDQDRFPAARVYTNVFQKKHGFKFTTRTIDGVLHVWRVA